MCCSDGVLVNFYLLLREEDAGSPAKGQWGLQTHRRAQHSCCSAHVIRASLQWGNSAPCPTAGCLAMLSCQEIVLLLWLGCFLCVRPAAGHCCSFILTRVSLQVIAIAAGQMDAMAVGVSFVPGREKAQSARPCVGLGLFHLGQARRIYLETTSVC